MYNTEVFSEYDDDDRYALPHDEYEETSNSHDDTEEESSSSSDSRNYYGTTYNNRPAVKDQRASNTKSEKSPGHFSWQEKRNNAATVVASHGPALIIIGLCTVVRLI